MNRRRFTLRTLTVAAVAGALLASALPASAATSDRTFNSPVSVGDDVYFAGTATGKGIELFRSDGTVAGTKLVKDIYPGAKSSMPGYETTFYPVGAKTFFYARSATGIQLWVTDGTSAGTINLATANIRYFNSAHGAAFNGEFYFTSTSRATGVELWKTDGTVAGTVFVQDFLTTADVNGKGDSSYPRDLRVVDGTLYVLARSASSKESLFASTDGATFSKIHDFAAYANNGAGLGAGFATELDGSLYFRDGSKLNRATGTTVTVAVAYLASPYGSKLIAFDGSIFTRKYTSSAYELVRVNGAVVTSLGVFPVAVGTANGQLYYVTRNDATKDARLFTMTSATATPTDLGSIGKWSSAFLEFSLLEVGDRTFFWSYLGLYATDGTPEGTALAADFGFGRGIDYYEAAVAGDDLVVAIRDSKKRGSLWVSDGTQAGTVQALASGVLTAPTPVVTGSPTVGTKLAATVGSWKPAPVALTYQWKLNGAAIEGATGRYFTIPEGMAGAITFAVTGRANSYQTVTKTSAAKLIAKNFEVAPTPTITGSKTVGSYLRAVPGTWSPAASFTYQWYSAGVKIATNGNRSTFKVTTATVGKPITVKVGGSAAGYVNTNRSSAAR